MKKPATPDLKSVAKTRSNLVFIHGFGADRYTWLGNVGQFEALHTVHTPEIPGHGLAPANHIKSLEQLAFDLISPVYSGLSNREGEYERMHLIGHSLGGGLALLYAAQHPDHVASLTLIAPIGLGKGVNTDFTEQFPHLESSDAALSLLQTLVYKQALISRQLLAPLLKHLKTPGITECLLQLSQLISTAQPVMETAKKAVIEAKIHRQVIWGLNDNNNPPQAGDETDFGGQWHWFDDCRHLPHIEHRLSFNHVLQQWLEHHTASLSSGATGSA